MKKKIIFFLTPEVTGAERVTVTLAKQLHQEEYDVSFAILGNTFGEIIYYIPNRYQYRLVPLLRLDEYLKKENPHEVFCSLIHLNCEVLQSAQRVGDIRVILRNNYLLKDVTDDLLQIAKATYPKADLVIAQTDQMKQELIVVCRVENEKIKVIDNPIDTEYIDEHVKGIPSPYPNDDRFHFCWVGRYDKIKGVDMLIEAFKEVCHKNYKVSLYLIGKEEPTSDYYQSIIKYVEQNQMNNFVHFIGFEKNPYKWMRKADCFLVTSRSEANSNVLKEARYLKVPIISTCNFGNEVTITDPLITFVGHCDTKELAKHLLYHINCNERHND